MEEEPVPSFASVEEEMAFWKAQQLETSKRLAEERDQKAKEAAEADARRAEYLMHVRSGAISIHKSIGEFLELRGGWGRTVNPDQKCDLFLAAWCGGGVEWGALGSAGSAHTSQRMLTNYYRGYQMLCYKDTCALNLQEYCSRPEVDINVNTLMPETFVFQFDSRTRVDREAFEAAYARHASIAGDKNIWIVKPARLQCGRGIFIESDLGKILEALDREAEGSVLDPKAAGASGEDGELGIVESNVDTVAGGGEGGGGGGGGGGGEGGEPTSASPAVAETSAGEATPSAAADAGAGGAPAAPAVAPGRATDGKVKTAWVIQKYVERPLLCSGGRKFDIRVWVLLTADYRIGLYREGVLRTTAVPYSLDNLNDQFAHLSNHCIATQHPDYGKVEATNEMWFRDFDDFLVATYGEEKGFYRVIYPQIRDIVRHSLLAVREQLENSPTASFEAFHLFGYDVMVTDDFRVTLIEINSSPAVAADLMPGMTRAIVHETVDNLFPPPDAVRTSGRLDAAKEKELSRTAALRTAKYATIDQELQSRAQSGGEATAQLQQHKDFDERFDML